MSFALRASEPLPGGRFSVSHYRAIHRHLFGDVYRWAGRYRRIRISKQGSMFCYPENIARQMTLLFEQLRRDRHLKGLNREDFAVKAASFLATLNHIHPFREGNGRTQVTFVAALAATGERPLDVGRLDSGAFLQAMISSFHGREELLRDQLLSVMG